jgi:hypothetical protein
MEHLQPHLDKRETTFSSSLAALYELHTFYNRFPTQETLTRRHILNTVIEGYKRKNIRVSLIFNGSLAYGQSVSDSDLDLTGRILHLGDITSSEITHDIHTAFAEEGKEVNMHLPSYPTVLSNDIKAWIENDPNREMSNSFGQDIGNDVMYLQGLLTLPHVEFSSDPEDPSTLVENAYKKYPYISSPNMLIRGYWPYYRRSFRKYNQRLAEHPDFQRFSSEQQNAYITILEDLPKKIEACFRVPV